MKKLMVIVAAMGFAVGVYAADAAKPAEAAKPAAPAVKVDDAAAAKAKAAELIKAEMVKADTNKDGKLSREEFVKGGRP